MTKKQILIVVAISIASALAGAGATKLVEKNNKTAVETSAEAETENQETDAETNPYALRDDGRSEATMLFDGYGYYNNILMISFFNDATDEQKQEVVDYLNGERDTSYTNDQEYADVWRVWLPESHTDEELNTIANEVYSKFDTVMFAYSEMIIEQYEVGTDEVTIDEAEDNNYDESAAGDTETIIYDESSANENEADDYVEPATDVVEGADAEE